MTHDAPAFDLEDFIPYLLNQAAEATSHGFQAAYRDRYGMTRTQWRIMANLGKFGAMTASEICAASHIEKTKVSRAVAVLEQQGSLARTPSSEDRRAEILSLTDSGMQTFAELGELAKTYDQELRACLGATDAATLTSLLRRLRKIGAQQQGGAGENG